MLPKFVLALGMVVLLSGTVLAGPNAGGTLIVHDPGIAYTTDSSSYPSAAPTCEPLTVDNQLSPEFALSGWVWKVYAAFPADSSPRLKAMAMGATFGSEVVVLAGGLANPGDFEIPQNGWPTLSGGGVGISFSTVQTWHITEVYWFGGYGEAGGIWSLAPHPSQEMIFVDDSVPPYEDPIAGLSTIGFGVAGSTICPVTPVEGACCYPSGACFVTFESSCPTGDWRAEVPCDPNPCPQPPPTGACCSPEGFCTSVVAADCDTGDWREGVPCDPNPCPQPPSGACCYPNGDCSLGPESECATGDWRIDVPCDPNPCPQPILGACCYPAGGCAELSEADCGSGDWRIGVPCDPNPCPQPPAGACCYLDGTCVFSIQVACPTGDWREGVPCDPNPCPVVPIGACCYPQGSCLVQRESDCMSGDWREGIPCAPNPCPQPETGACCLHMGCIVVTWPNCNGTWQGAGTDCEPNPCCTATGAPAPTLVASSDVLSSPGPGAGRVEQENRTNPCPGSELHQNDDNTFENAFTWTYGGVQAPDYGAFAEGYPEVNGTVCGIELCLTRWGTFDGVGAVDLYVWSFGPNDNPGSVLSVTTCVSVSGVAYWPGISAHDFDCMDAMTQTGVFVGYWPRSFEWGVPQFGCAMDQDGPGGIPRTNIAPGIGYPTGWQSPAVAGFDLQAFGIRPFVGGGSTPVKETSWGRIKELYHR